jgi:N-acetylglucosamine-6-phosphate deacetylase
VPEFKKMIAGIYLEGPFVNPSKKGGINPEYIRKPDVDYLKKIIDISGGWLRMMTIAPELDGIDNIIELLLQNDIIPGFGHSNASLNTALNTKGVKNMTHLFNAMSGISHRAPGLAALPFVNRDIFVEVNGDGIHIDNNIIKMAYLNLYRDKLIFITDAVVSAGKPYGEYIYDNKKVVSSERGVRYSDNDVLMGSNNLIPDVLRNVTHVTGGDIVDILRTVTLNPAKLLGIDDRKGSIEPGKKADIVIFDKDFRVGEVIFG